MGNRDFTLTVHTQNLMCTGTQGKSNNLIGALARPTCWFWKDSQRGGGEGVAEIHAGDIDSGGSHIWEHSTVWTLLLVATILESFL